MKNLYFFILILVISCKDVKKHEIEHIEPKFIKKVSTKAYIPNSYVFSKVPVCYDGFWYYLDKSNGSIVKLNKDFTYHSKTVVVGEGPHKIGKAYQMSLADNFLFVIGNFEIIIYDMIKNDIVNKYKHQLGLMQQVHYHNKEFLTSYIDETDRKLYIVSFKFDHKKLYDISKLVRVNYEKGTHVAEKSGWLISTADQKLVFIKDWMGESYLYDDNFNLIKSFQLPYSGKKDFNKNFDDNGFTSYYFEAYSVAQYNDKIAIMRELDFEEKSDFNINEDINDKYVRSRIHIFDKNMILKQSLKVPNFSTQIYFKNDTLLTLNYEDEFIYLYDINY